MEEIKVKAIVLSSRDYKEKDKLVDLYCLEFGKITALLKGCKMPTSKLRFAYQPFCFADFLITKQNNHFLIINCTLIDSFYDLVNDTANFMQSSMLLEIVNNLSYVQEYHSVFINLIYALKSICYGKINCKLVTIKFIMEILKILGFEANFKLCSICKLPFINKIYLNFDSGAFVCHNCYNNLDVEFSKNEFASLRIINSCEFERLGSIKIKDDVLNNIFKNMVTNLELKLDCKFKTTKLLI